MKIMPVVLATLLALTIEAKAVTSYKLFDVCGLDIDTYCKTIKRNQKKAIKECLAKNQNTLSSRCQDHYKEAR